MPSFGIIRSDKFLHKNDRNMTKKYIKFINTFDKALSNGIMKLFVSINSYPKMTEK